ncbi:MAG: winged helix DNA-binding domain-containing protein [Thermoplasmata archaeon]|nr:winged helix DNA-binding domain-containing protein [Thermoplasmata archaeon]
MNATKEAESVEITAAQSAAFRLRHHHLLKRAGRGHVPAVARDVGGIQAQVESAAKASLRARIEGLSREDVDRALWEDRSLAKLWLMRGTVHLVSADDLWIYVGGLQKEGLFRERQWMRRYWDLAEEDLNAMPRAAEEALTSGPMTRHELGEAIVERFGERARKWVEHGYGGIIRLSTIEGRVCFGPNRGREITFVRVDNWLGAQPTSPSEEAEDALLRRYLHAFGPASPHDFAAWSGMRMGIVRETWDRIGDDLQTVLVEGQERTVLADEMNGLVADEPNPSARLLPYFDTYLLGHKDKGHLVDPAHYKRVYRKAGWISPTLLVDGRVAGIWSQKGKGKRLEVAVDPFEPLDAAVREAVEAEVADLGRFLGQEAELVFSS